MCWPTRSTLSIKYRRLGLAPLFIMIGQLRHPTVVQWLLHSGLFSVREGDTVAYEVIVHVVSFVIRNIKSALKSNS